MLDIKTVTVLIILSALVVCPVQLMAARRYSGYIGRAIKCWGSGLAVTAAGHILLVLRNIAPDFFPMVLGNTLIIAGFAGYHLAVCELKQQRPIYRYYGAVLAAVFLLFSYFLYGQNNMIARIFVANLGVIALLLPLCQDLLFRVRPDRRATYWPAGIIFAFGVLMLLGRTVVTATGYYTAHPDLLAGSVMQTLLFVSSFLASVVSGLFFMLMAGDEFAAQVSRLASYDSLTEIFNRRAFEEQAGQLLSKGQKKGSHSSLLTLDLDYFKTINDQYGHVAGDMVLKKVVAAISPQLRTGDVFGRYGGEEFCVLLPQTGREEAQVVAERLRQAVQELVIQVGGKELALTISIGISIDTNQGKDLGARFGESDMALYQAKSLGRNRVACQEPAVVTT